LKSSAVDILIPRSLSTERRCIGSSRQELGSQKNYTSFYLTEQYVGASVCPVWLEPKSSDESCCERYCSFPRNSTYWWVLIATRSSSRAGFGTRCTVVAVRPVHAVRQVMYSQRLPTAVSAHFMS